MEWKGPESLKPGTEKARVVRIRNGKADIYKTGMEQDGMYKTGIENPESLKSGTEKAGIYIFKFGMEKPGIYKTQNRKSQNF